MDERPEAPAVPSPRDGVLASPLLHPLLASAVAGTPPAVRQAQVLLSHVPPVLVRRVAAAVRPVIEQVSRYRDFDWADIEPELIAGRMQLWIAGQPGRLSMACITEVQKRPRATVGVVVYIAGAHRERWLHFLPVVEQWMREQGCTRIEAWCRRGWERVLPQFRKTHVLMEKPL